MQISKIGTRASAYGWLVDIQECRARSVRVPLIFKPLRGVSIEKISAPVSLIDVAPALAQIGAGRSLGVGNSMLGASVPRTPVHMQYFGGNRDLASELSDPI
jgi:hypothetical protein